MSRTNPPPRRRAALFTAGLLVATAMGTGGMLQGTAHAAAFACDVNYSANDWGSGFTANVAITNTGDAAASSWSLSYDYSGNQRLQQGWNGQWSQSGQTVTVDNPSWGGNLAPGATVSAGANFSYSGTNAAPTSFTVNGVSCGDEDPPVEEQSVVISPSSLSVRQGTSGSFGVKLASQPDSNVTVSVARTSGNTNLSISGSSTLTFTPSNWNTEQNVTVAAAATGTGSAVFTASAPGLDSATITVTQTAEDVDPPGERVDNPYVDAGVYVNPDWRAHAMAEPGGERIADQPTGVWLDRRSAITGGSAGNSTGLREHLDNAVVQAQDHENFVFQVVVYNLPGRDCAALSSQGELEPDEIDVYKNEFIDPIAEILSDPAYSDLRIVAIIEIDSLPNLVTNVTPRETATEDCDVMAENQNYQEGIAYALNELGAIPNVYNYIDAGHYGWIGWDNNLGASAELFHETALRDGGSVDNVHGFIVNTANYGPTVEPYFSIDDTVNGTSVRNTDWVDWNRYVDNQSFAQGFRQELISQGFDSGIGMLIDTSRNGWGGPDRPTGPGPMTSANEYVEGSRIDQRYQTGNWCNQAGAGLGERPTTAPAPGIDAYVWIKPPGESDGASEDIPNPEGKGYDRMCDPTYEGNVRNGNNPSGALPDAPLSGHWFSAQFQELMANAYPPLD